MIGQAYTINSQRLRAAFTNSFICQIYPGSVTTKGLIAFFAQLALCACTTLGVEQPGELPALSGQAQARRFAALQYALEHNLDDHPRSWEVSPTLFGTIAPIETVLSSTDGWCRDYEEIIADGPRRYRLVGIACRKPGPRWLVLDVRPFVEQSARQ